MNETDDNVTNYIIQIILQQSELCNDALYLTVYETAAIHSQDTQNPAVHDMIIYASHVIGGGQGHILCMVHKKKKDFFMNHSSFRIWITLCNRYAWISFSDSDSHTHVDKLIQAHLHITKVIEQCQELH